MIISKVTIEDIPQVSALQEQLLLSNIGTGKGFLVSGFSSDDYLRFVEKYDFFYKAVEGDQIVGVLMAFHSKDVAINDKNNCILRDSVIGESVIIKQVFVSPNAMGKGISSKLYAHLYGVVGDATPLVCVIVIEPFNERSCIFHKKQGFVEYLHFIPDADRDGIVRKRSTWIRLPNSSSDITNAVRMTNIYCTDDDDGSVMASRALTFASLYTHEDNLNWTKIGLQVTILFALFTSFAYFYDNLNSRTSVFVLTVLSLWGVAINFLFYIKIKSGIEYMNSHKSKINEYDKVLSFYYPKIIPTFSMHEKFANKSITARILPWVSLGGVIAWIAVVISLLPSLIKSF